MKVAMDKFERRSEMDLGHVRKIYKWGFHVESFFTYVLDCSVFKMNATWNLIYYSQSSILRNSSRWKLMNTETVFHVDEPIEMEHHWYFNNVSYWKKFNMEPNGNFQGLPHDVSTVF